MMDGVGAMTDTNTDGTPTPTEEGEEKVNNLQILHSIYVYSIISLYY